MANDYLVRVYVDVVAIGQSNGESRDEVCVGRTYHNRDPRPKPALLQCV